MTIAPSAEYTKHVRQMIDQLDDADPGVRRAASLQLNSLSGSALEPIESALRDGAASPESQARLKLALKYVAPRAQRETEALARRIWEGKILHEGYQKFGHTDPARDAAAHRAIDLFLTLGPDPLHGPPEPRHAALRAFQDALGAGPPRDPLLWCLQYAVKGTFNDTAGPGADVGIFAFQDVASGHYPPAAQMIAGLAHFRCTDGHEEDEGNALAKLLGVVGKLPDLPAGELEAMADGFYAAVRHSSRAPVLLDAFSASYRAVEPKQIGPRLFDARRLIDFSYQDLWADWTADSIPDLQKAKTLLEEAYVIDPHDGRTPSLMVFDLSAMSGAREEMEIWYTRAMAADPDNFKAALRKLVYLNKHASAEDMLRFGRECLATDNWRGDLPGILTTAHDWLADRSGDSAAYTRRPEVWADIRAVYEGAVLNFPDNPLIHSNYVRAAAACDHWDVAWQQLQIIGDHPDLGAFGSREAYDYLRRKARRLAAAQTLPASTKAQ